VAAFFVAEMKNKCYDFYGMIHENNILQYEDLGVNDASVL
jgi:hypothetical protein